MRRPGQAGGAIRRCVMRAVPAWRREWVEAVWAEASEVPPGFGRLAWRVGGIQLIAREALMRRSLGSAMLFAVAAAAAAWAAWPGSPAYLAASGHRAFVLALVLVLAGLPLLARPFLGPVSGSRAARLLRVGFYAAILALIPARNIIEQVADVPPHGSAQLRLYRLIDGGNLGQSRQGEILFVILMALYVAVILWMTSRRSRVEPATLATGTAIGIALGLVMYTVAPLGLSQDATNPWLPGSDVDPLVVLAWVLLLCGPLAAALVADWRFTAASDSLPPAGARNRQIMAAGLLTSLTGALLVAVLGNGTTAVMLKATWLRNWLYHGKHLLYGVQYLSSDLRTSAAIAYGHQITASVDTSVFFPVFIFFPVFALGLAGFAAFTVWGNSTAGGDSPGRGGGGPPRPEAAPDPPDGIGLADLSAAKVAVSAPGLHESGPCIETASARSRLALLVPPGT
jgi:hypothetical protein